MSSANASNNNGLRARLKNAIKTKPHLFIIFVISIIGFCYHFSGLLKEYLKYKTTVTYSVEEPEGLKYGYPAVTICLKDMVPYFRLKEMFPEYLDAVNGIMNESKSRQDSTFWTKDESKDYTGESIQRKKISGKNLSPFFKEKLLLNSTVLEILEKWEFGQPDQCILDSKPLTKNSYRLNYCENVTKPIVSINADFRCFTFFSQLNRESDVDPNLFKTSLFSSSKSFESRNNKVAYITYILDLTQRWHPFETDLRGRLAIHSSNSIPVPYFYPTIPVYQFSRIYDIQFSRTVSHLLEKPYETNCKNYDFGVNSTLQSFDHCFTKCVMNRYREKCKCLPRSGLLYHKSLLEPNDKFCAKTNLCQFYNYRSNCTKECQPDCLSEQYTFDKFADIPFYDHNNLTGIQITRKPVLEQVYRHSPSKTPIDLICDFGGLGGLWLGFSVITICTAIISLISRPIVKIVETNEKKDEKRDEKRDAEKANEKTDENKSEV